MYNRLKSILTTNQNGLNKTNGGGPTSLNFTYRKAVINKINEENNAFLNKLQGIKSTVPNVKSLERVHENLDNYKSLASNYAHGKKRLDPLVDKHMRHVINSSKMSGSRMNSVRSINTSLPSINQSGIALLTAGPINLANATVGIYGGEQERSSFRDQY